MRHIRLSNLKDLVICKTATGGKLDLKEKKVKLL